MLAGVLGMGVVTPAAGQQVCDGSWSTPFTLRTADGRPVYVERGVIASDGDRTLVLGTPTFVWLTKDSIFITPSGDAEADAQSVLQHAGVLVDTAGVATPVPPFGDAHLARSPRLLAATTGRKSIAWEVADSAPEKTVGTPVVAVTAATLTDGHWDDSHTLIERGRLFVGNLPAVRSVDKIDHRVLASAVRDSTRRVRLAWASAASWKRTDWLDADWVALAAATRTKAGDIAMLFMGSVANEAGVYTVLGILFGDSLAWRRPVLLDSLSGPFEAPSSAHRGNDSLLAVWPQSRNHRSEMITALTVDGGRHWSLTEPLVSSLWMDSLVLAVDGAGVVHLIYRDAPENVLNKPRLIMHSVWRSGVWSAPRAVSNHPSYTGPMLGSAQGGRLMAVWMESAAKLPALLPKSVASLWTPGCTSR
jgi:hypothetical protein